MDDLLPCPFCGGTDLVKSEINTISKCPEGEVYCNKEGCAGNWSSIPVDRWQNRVIFPSNIDTIQSQFQDSLRAEREKYDNLHAKIEELVNLSYIGLCAAGYKKETDKLASELDINIYDSSEAILRRLDSIIARPDQSLKILRIKEVRDITRCGLKDAKEFVERHYNLNGFGTRK